MVAISTAASAVFAGLLTLLTWRLFMVGRNQHQAAMRSNEISRKSARAAVQAADAATKSADMAERAMTVVERAYLFVGAGSFEAVEGKLSTLYLRIANVGKTPARLTGYLVQLSEKPPTGPEPHYEKAPIELDNIIPAGGDMSAGPIVGVPSTFVVTGYVAYRDLFGTEHTSRFCTLIEGVVDHAGKQTVSTASVGPPAWNAYD